MLVLLLPVLELHNVKKVAAMTKYTAEVAIRNGHTNFCTRKGCCNSMLLSVNNYGMWIRPGKMQKGSNSITSRGLGAQYSKS